MQAQVVSLSVATDRALHGPGTGASALRAILDPEVNLALGRRECPSSVAAEVARLSAASCPDRRCRTTLASRAADIQALLRDGGLDASRFRRWIADMAALVERFADLVEDRPMTLRIETLADDGCRRFHVDRTHLRLVCTYRGPGTEWLANPQVDREALVSGQPNEAILRHGEPRRMAPFWVGVMKGECFPGNAGKGLVHRSPPIAGTGQVRVLFCLDA